jgi:hypothetical protein
MMRMEMFKVHPEKGIIPSYRALYKERIHRLDPDVGRRFRLLKPLI